MKVSTLNHPILQRVADGYVDEKIVTVRRMLREGRNSVEIAEEIGCHKATARNYIARNGLPIPGPDARRHVHDRSWYADALSLRGKMTRRQIAAVLGRSHGAVSGLFARVDNGLLDLEKIGASA